VKLYELAVQYQKILDAIEDAEGELSDEQMAELVAVEDDFRTKTESIAKLIRSLEADVEAIKAERKRLADRQETLSRKVEWLQRYVLEALRSTGTTKVKGELLSITRRKAPVSCEVLDADEVPAAFKREIVEVKVDRSAVIAHFKTTGEVVPGVQLHTENEYLVIS